MRDTQRKRVYSWETWTGIRNGAPLDIHSARAFLAKAWRRLAPKSQRDNPPFLQDGRGVTRGYGSRSRINLPRRYRNRWTLLHEMAHGLIPWDLAAHGPEFVRVLIAALARYEGRDERFLCQEARRNRVKVASRAAVKKLGIRI